MRMTGSGDLERRFKSKALSRSTGRAKQGEAPVVSLTNRLELRLVIGNDHGGFLLRGALLDVLTFWGYPFEDVGTSTDSPVDFPDIVKLACQRIKNGLADRAILLGGTGVGACIAANKVRGIRAAVCHDAFSARQCVEHDDVNVLCMGAWIIGSKTMEQILASFLTAQFSTEEHFRRRVAKLDRMNKEV